jgi:tetratricopeptide (TPR) repeat protein
MVFVLALSLGACRDPASDLLAKGREAMQSDNLEGAADSFREVTIQFPESPQAAEALFELAQIHYFNRRDAEAAHSLLLKILTDYRTSAVTTEAQRLLARIYEADLHDPEKALTQYRALLEIEQSPDRRRSTLLAMADCFYHMDRMNDALETYREVIRLPYHPDTDGAYFRLANLELLVGSPENALESLRRLAASTRDDGRRFDARLSEIEVLTSLGRFSEARHSIERLLRSDCDPEPVNELLIRLRSVELEHESLDDEAQSALLHELQKQIRWGGGRRRARPSPGS